MRSGSHPHNNKQQGKHHRSNLPQLGLPGHPQNSQQSNNDWEWEKDSYLIKDIRDLVADSVSQPDPIPIIENGINSNPKGSSWKFANQGEPKRAGREGADPLKIEYFAPPQTSASTQKQGMNHGETSQRSIKSPRMPDLAIQSQPSQNIKQQLHNQSHDRGLSVGHASSRVRIPIGEKFPIPQPRLPSDLRFQQLQGSKRVDPVAKEIAAQGNHQKQQQKTQDEFLLSYIKNFQDAMAESQAYKKQQNRLLKNQVMVANGSVNTNDRRVDRSEVINNSQQPNSSFQQNQSQHKKANPQISHQSDRYPFGITITIEDKKSGFKGHKHVIDSSKAFGGCSVGNKQSTQKDALLCNRNSIIQEDSQQLTTLGMSSIAAAAPNNNQLTIGSGQDSILPSQILVSSRGPAALMDEDTEQHTLSNGGDDEQQLHPSKINVVDNIADDLTGHQTLSDLIDKELGRPSQREEDQPAEFLKLEEESFPDKSPQKASINEAAIQSEEMEKQSIIMGEEAISKKSSTVVQASHHSLPQNPKKVNEQQKCELFFLRQNQYLEEEEMERLSKSLQQFQQTAQLPQRSNVQMLPNQSMDSKKQQAESQVEKIREARVVMAAQESDRYSENRIKLDIQQEQLSLRQQRRSFLKMHFQSTYKEGESGRSLSKRRRPAKEPLDDVRVDEFAQSFKNSKQILPSLQGTLKSPQLRYSYDPNKGAYLMIDQQRTEQQLPHYHQYGNPLSKSLHIPSHPKKGGFFKAHLNHDINHSYTQSKGQSTQTSPNKPVGLKSVFSHPSTTRQQAPPQLRELAMVEQIVSDVERHHHQKASSQRYDTFRSSVGAGFFDKRIKTVADETYQQMVKKLIKGTNLRKSLGYQKQIPLKPDTIGQNPLSQSGEDGGGQKMGIKLGNASKTGVEWMRKSVNKKSFHPVQERFRPDNSDDDDSGGIIAKSTDNYNKMMMSMTQGKQNRTSYGGEGAASMGLNHQAFDRSQRTPVLVPPIFKEIRTGKDERTFQQTNDRRKEPSSHQLSKEFSQLPRSINSGGDTMMDQQSKTMIKSALQNAKTTHTAQSFVHGTPQRNNNQQMVSLTDNVQSKANDSVERPNANALRQSSRVSDHPKPNLAYQSKYGGEDFSHDYNYSSGKPAGMSVKQEHFEKINTIYKKPHPSHTRQVPPLVSLPKSVPQPHTHAHPTGRKMDSLCSTAKNNPQASSIKDFQSVQSKQSPRVTHRRENTAASASPTPRLGLGSKIVPPSPPPQNVHRSHTRDDKNDTLSPPPYKRGQIIEFDVENLLHPLRFICQKKMLCSCNERPPKQRTPRRAKSPRERKPPSPTAGESSRDCTGGGGRGDSGRKDGRSSSVAKFQERLENLEKEETQAVAKMLNKVEWKNTPVYKQTFNLKLTEMDTLKDTSIGMRRYREMQKQKGKTTGQIALDLKDEKLRRILVDRALKNIYLEPEVSYLLKIVKNKNLNDAQMLLIYEKGLDTLEVLMAKLGLDEAFQKVLNHYETLKHKDTQLMKVLTRCMVMYESLGKITVIFKLMRRRSEMEQRFIDWEVNWVREKKFLGTTPEQRVALNTQKLASLEQDVAQYCFHSCRLWVQINSFMIDHSLLNAFKFKFGGVDYKQLIREQVEITRAKFGGLFGFDKIPLMDEEGRLYYDTEQIVRVGGGYGREGAIEERRSESPPPERPSGQLTRPDSKTSRGSPLNHQSALASRRGSRL